MSNNGADARGHPRARPTLSDATHVCAVVASSRAEGGSLEATVEALERQTRPPDEVIALPPGGHEALPTGLAARADWVWLLDGSVVPEPAALETLLGASGQWDELPVPGLLASKVVLPDGSLDKASLPVAQIRDPDVTVSSFERHLLSIRVARRGSLLVHRWALEAMDSQWPKLTPFADDLEWSARLLKDRLGLLVPGSVAVRSQGGQAALPGRELARRIRLLLGDAIEFGDKPWFAFRFAEEALAELRMRGLNRS